MRTFSRPASAALTRIVAGVLLPVLLGGVVWMDATLRAQQPGPKPAKEEEEDPKPVKPVKPRPRVEEEEETVKPKRKVVRVEEEGKQPKRPAKNVDVPDTGDLVTAARQTKNDMVFNFLNAIAEPHDIVVNRNLVKRIAPVEEYLGNPPRFVNRIRLVPFLDDQWVQDKPWDATSGALTGISYYEEIVRKRVEEFLEQPLDRNPKAKNYVSRQEMLRLAEIALKSALSYHQSARERNKRRGDGFEPLEEALGKKLLDIQLEQLRLLADGSDWDAAFAEAIRLAAAYPDPEDQQRIAGPLARVIGKAVQGGSYTEEQLLVLQQRLRQVEERFPNSAALQPINERLKAQAQDLFARAKDLEMKGQRKEALDLLRRAEAIWRRLPELRDYRLRLDNALAVLRVGVRELPVNMSPQKAWTDSEKQAVELLFESLVKVAYEPEMGRHYVPGLAEDPPSLVPLGRQFQLARDAYWSNDKPVTAADVRHTVRLLKNPRWCGYNPAWQTLLDEAHVGSDPYRVTLTLRQGFLDPLSLMTFKIMPAEPWPGQSLTVNDEERFAHNPVGSGPYHLQGGGTTAAGRPYVSFVASSSFGTRAGKEDLPHIREIQFIQMHDPVKEWRAGELDLIPDLPSDQVKSLQQAVPAVQMLPPMANQRVWFLAVNHRRTVLQNQWLRRAIAHAINREKTLDAVFRSGLGKNVHRALNSPYPAGCWACAPAAEPFSLETARSSIKRAESEGVRNVKLTLKYPQDDPRVAQAMQAVREQVKEIGVDLELVPVPPRALHEQVENAHDYDLAYYHHDYPSGTYWLWPLFDPSAMEGRGSNFLGYHNDGQLQTQFGTAMGHRDFPQVQKMTHALHAMLLEKMPLIPLWQLDTHVVVSPHLTTGSFDPLLVFTNVEQWRLEKK